MLTRTLTGLLFGTVLLGIGGRLVMRGLAFVDGRAPAISIGGSAEVVLYGAIIGAIAGAAYSLSPARFRRRWPVAGALVAIAAYAGTLLTLPAHISATAAPFAERMPFVHIGFGTCFLLFGLALARRLR